MRWIEVQSSSRARYLVEHDLLENRFHFSRSCSRGKLESAATDSHSLRPKPCAAPSDIQAPTEHRPAADTLREEADHRPPVVAAARRLREEAAGHRLQAAVRHREEVAVHTRPEAAVHSQAAVDHSQEAADSNRAAVEAAGCWRWRCR
jgi:hypothetical protein